MEVVPSEPSASNLSRTQETAALIVVAATTAVIIGSTSGPSGMSNTYCTYIVPS